MRTTKPFSLYGFGQKQMGGEPTPVYTPQYQTLLDKLEADTLTLPSSEVSAKDELLAQEMTVNGIFDESYIFYLCGWYNAYASLYNWADPDNYKCSFVGTMGVAEHSVGHGYASKAASGLNTNFNPFAAGVPMQCSMWFFAENLATQNLYMGYAGPPNMYMGRESGNIYSRFSTAEAELIGAITPGTQFLGIKRLNATTIAVYENATLKGTYTRNYNSIVNNFIYLCCAKLASGVYVPTVGVTTYAAGLGTGNLDLPAVYTALINRRNA